jgi:potassium-transporting ATPase KdpC subunit
MLEELGPAFRFTVIFTVLTGLVYPLAMTGISQLIFSAQANGSLVRVNDEIVGSRLIGQNFSMPQYFHPRPSSAGNGYDATTSGGSNLGPTSAKLLRGTTAMDGNKNETVSFDGISLRVLHYCLDNDIPYESSVPLDRFKNENGELDDVKLVKAFNDETAALIFRPKTSIPADAVTASSSGLDPHISPANADVQARRVARSRHVPLDQIKQLIAQNTQKSDLGFLGEPRVNVLTLNVAIDLKFSAPKQ